MIRVLLLSAVLLTPVAVCQDRLAVADESLARFEETAGQLPALQGQARQLQAEYQAAAQAGDRARMARLEKAFGELRTKMQSTQADLSKIHDETVALYEKVLEGDPGAGRAYTGLASLKFATGDLDGGAADLARAIELAPDEIRNQELLAAYKFGLMEWEEALVAARRSIAAGHKVDRMRSIEAQILFYQEDFAGAAEAFGRMAGANPQVEQMVDMANRYVEFAKEEAAIRAAESAADDLPRVRIDTDKGPIVLELFENEAPNTVANFIELAGKGFFDGIVFHRVIPNFMSQGGDPNSKDADPSNDGQGGPGYRFADELGDGYRRHFAGVLSMANAGPNTNGSQFFLTFVPTWHLNGKHTVFGRVIEGMDVVYRIRKGTRIEKAVVLRKRDHAYAVEKLR